MYSRAVGTNPKHSIPQCDSPTSEVSEVQATVLLLPWLHHWSHDRRGPRGTPGQPQMRREPLPQGPSQVLTQQSFKVAPFIHACFSEWWGDYS